VQLPTTPGELQSLEASVSNIIKKVDKLPIDQIGNQLRRDLADLDLTLSAARGTLNTASGTMVSARTTINNAGNFVQPNSAQSQELDSMLLEISRAARSVRVLADYLERHPEALVRGKTGEAK